MAIKTGMIKRWLISLGKDAAQIELCRRRGVAWFAGKRIIKFDGKDYEALPDLATTLGVDISVFKAWVLKEEASG